MNIIEEIVPFGKENAIKRCELAHMLCTTDRGARRMVNEARMEGIIIINAGDGAGYYQSTDPDEMRKQAKQMHSRAMSLLIQEAKMLKRIKEIEEGENGQLGFMAD